MDCSPPGSSVHGVAESGIAEGLSSTLLFLHFTNQRSEAPKNLCKSTISSKPKPGLLAKAFVEA